MSSADYSVESHRTSDRDDECEITVRRNGKIIYLRFYPSQFRDSPSAAAHYQKCLNVLKSGEEVVDDLFDDEALDWLVKPFEPLMTEFAPEPPEALGTPTLAKYYLADFLVFTLDVEREELRPRRVEVPKSGRMQWARISDEVAKDLSLSGWTKRYSPSQVEICYDQLSDVLQKPPCRVRVEGHDDTCFFKRIYPGSSPEAIEHELDAFNRISRADLGPQTRICRLLGVVSHENDQDWLMGMLLTSIDERLPLDRAMWSASPALKTRWMTQIEETLAELHRAGLVWGDVKTHNVLIDNQDNAWIIDFGGSYTEGWVDKELAGTVEGDLQGLARIRKALSQP